MERHWLEAIGPERSERVSQVKGVEVCAATAEENGRARFFQFFVILPGNLDFPEIHEIFDSIELFFFFFTLSSSSSSQKRSIILQYP